MPRFALVTAIPLVLCGALSSGTPTLAKPVDWQALAGDPKSYLDQEVEVTGYCTKGGAKGDVLGYECTTDGDVYVDARDIEPATVKQKLDETCGGKDVIERSSFCRATIRFAPRSFTVSNTVEPGKSITIFNTDKAQVEF